MMNNNEYEKSRKRIEDILNSKTKIKEVDSLSNDEAVRKALNL